MIDLCQACRFIECMNRTKLLYLILPAFLGCASAPPASSSSNPPSKTSTTAVTTAVKTTDPAPAKKATKTFQPAGPKERILDQSGEEIEITDLDPEQFWAPSKDPNEHFRVVLSSDSYQLRQIRGSHAMRKKPDTGGDQLLMEEVAKYDQADFKDDGIIIVNLNSKTGKIEKVNFHTRLPRIHDLAKIMQNDLTRWNLEHKKEDAPEITRFTVSYYIILRSKASRTDVKEMLKKEVRR